MSFELPPAAARWHTARSLVDTHVLPPSSPALLPPVQPIDVFHGGELRTVLSPSTRHPHRWFPCLHPHRIIHVRLGLCRRRLHLIACTKPKLTGCCLLFPRLHTARRLGPRWQCATESDCSPDGGCGRPRADP
jgi:hypothetical protein